MCHWNLFESIITTEHTTFHREENNYDRELNDQHTNNAQNLIKSQFVIEGLQLTLY